jgi:phosphoribosyl 1,2-cyclic phosphodiesterase
MPVQFAVLASGSRGNASLIRSGGDGLLLDLGLGPRAMAQRLESVGAAWSSVGSALLTHTHGDHIDNLTLLVLARKKIVLYCHEGHRVEMGRHPGFQALDAEGLVRHYDERPFLTPAGMRVEPLELRHDGGPTFGFRVEARAGRSGRPVAIGYLADTGSWTEEMAGALAEVDLLGVEFNHDVEMQRTSRRHPALIARNLGDWGHLSNEQGAGLVSAVLDRSGPRSVRHLVLLHLSQQCNRPGLAVGVARAVLHEKGRRVAVHAAQQAPAHPNLWVEAVRRGPQAGGPNASPNGAVPLEGSDPAPVP